jgi:hypothetical protein
MRPSFSRTDRSRHRSIPALGVAVVGVALALMAAPAASAQSGGSGGSDASGSDLSRVLLLAGDDGLRAQGMDANCDPSRRARWGLATAFGSSV